MSEKEKSPEKKKMGRPVVFTEEDLQNIGKRMCEWCRRPGNWHISGFEDEEGLATNFCCDMARSRPAHFSRIYKKAKAILGRKIMALTMEKSGPSPWMQATLLPFYLTDIDEHLDRKVEKEAIAKESAKKMAEAGVDERTEKLLKKMDQVIEASDAKNPV